MYGLLLGYLVTWPMKWMMVKINRKRGVGGMRVGKDQPIRSSRGRYGLLTLMGVLGVAALIVPAWLVGMREGTPLGSGGTSSAQIAGSGDLTDGLHDSLLANVGHLERHQGAAVQNAQSGTVDEVTELQPDAVEVVLSGARDGWGMLDIGEELRVQLLPGALTQGAFQVIEKPAESAVPAGSSENQLSARTR